MARPPRIAPLITPLVAALALLIASPPSLAQSDPGSSGAGANSESLSVQFPGGTLREYVNALNAATETPLNIILQNEAADLPVPPIELRSVAVGTALEVAVPDRSEVFMADDGSQGRLTQTIRQINSDSRFAPAYIINVVRQTRRPGVNSASSQPSTSIEVFSLAEIVRDESEIESALHAVDIALGLSPSSNKAELKYHEETGLLIVSGTKAQIKSINKVIVRLSDAAESGAISAQARAARVLNARATMFELQADVEELELMRALAAEELTATAKLAEKNMATDQDVRKANSKAKITESRLKVARARFAAGAETLRGLGAQTDRSELRSEMREYTFKLYGMQRNLVNAAELIKAMDSISGHIAEVEASEPREVKVRGKADIVSEISVRADEEGIKVIRMALSGRWGAMLEKGD